MADVKETDEIKMKSYWLKKKDPELYKQIYNEGFCDGFENKFLDITNSICRNKSKENIYDLLYNGEKIGFEIFDNKKYQLSVKKGFMLRYNEKFPTNIKVYMFME